MAKKWSPKKIRKFLYPKAATKTVDEWFVKYANFAQISKKLGMGRTTLIRWRDKIEKEDKSLQDFATVSQYKRFVELELEDYQAFDAKRKQDAKKKQEMSKQAKQLTAQLRAQGFDVKIIAPVSVNEAKNNSKQSAKFEQIFILDTANDAEMQSKARALLKKMSQQEQKQYFEYKKKHSNE